jgi:hypothetical protein
MGFMLPRLQMAAHPMERRARARMMIRAITRRSFVILTATESRR